MEELQKLIKIKYTSSCSDGTHQYDITMLKTFSFREFILAVLSTKEWGEIEINNHIHGCHVIEYYHGEITKGFAYIDELDAIVTDISGWGGWSMSDYSLVLKIGE